MSIQEVTLSTVKWRVMTPEQAATKRAQQSAWYLANRDRLRARDRERHAAERRNRKIVGRVDIECAIARGLSVPQIMVELGVTADVVHATWDYLDECVAS